MKTILLLVFLVSLPSVLGRPLTLRGSCLDHVNDLRQEYAQKYNIANMNQLVYDEDWEDNIQRYLGVHGSCEQKERVQNGMAIMTGTLENDELFNPDSSRMACLKSKCVETGEDVYTFLLDEGSSPMVYGSPGTRCPQDHPFGDNGLCASRKTPSRKNLAGKRRNFGYNVPIPDIPGFPKVPKPLCILCEPEWEPEKENPMGSGGGSWGDVVWPKNIPPLPPTCVCIKEPCGCSNRGIPFGK
ncbi:hypothetical protein CAEBREN_03225 [Caenorhabditis brenneri]|uniref:SCP domain-containing protein n=1 Tax=Caenorhabditis brenneri TaxID=135651 RepID=G0MD51_CAEBE|nr:hypothetical protein CAEBREN_03225 [Caenorhabditis brenneri]